MPPRSLAPSDSRIGNRAASVFPDPVGATMRRCDPARISDSARACMSLIFEISARRSNWASVVLPCLLRSFVSNHPSDRIRMIKTVRRVRRTYGSRKRVSNFIELRPVGSFQTCCSLGTRKSWDHQCPCKQRAHTCDGLRTADGSAIACASASYGQVGAWPGEPRSIDGHLVP